MSRPTSPTIEDFINYIGNSEVLLSAFVETVHRFWYDECFSSYSDRPFDTDEVKFISELYHQLWLFEPDFRYKFKKRMVRFQCFINRQSKSAGAKK